MYECVRYTHKYHMEIRATALVSVAFPAAPLLVILHFITS